MRTIFLGFALLLAGPRAASAQAPAKPAAPKPAGIAWATNRPLTWADFQGRPKFGEPEAALTSADLLSDAKCVDFVFSATVTPTFDPITSWVRDAKAASPALLRHEQLHFDLAEVYARHLRQKLKTATLDCQKLQPAFGRLTQAVYDQWSDEENRYDIDTNHGLNAAKQAVWEKKVQQQLAEMAAFAQ
ncbi:DUF922 domain-containing protein [Hymenobacter nivis]|nr:DUF922 domain-containing protein [Hymenobacter nivis]